MKTQNTPLTLNRIFALLLITALGAGSACADLLIDRGLPTANLNNAAGANRSNVAWVFANPPGSIPSDYYLYGDSFANTSAQTYSISTIRLWVVGAITSVNLWGGLNGGSITSVSNTYAATPVTYSGGASYEGTSGGSIPITQIDFSVNITLAAGQTYDFFLDGTGGTYTIPFTHASNAALSGSPQDGSDNLLLYAEVNGGNVVDVGSFSSGDPDGGWDKPSDLNVQVFGSVPDSGTTVAMLGLGLLGIAGFSLRKRAAKL